MVGPISTNITRLRPAGEPDALRQQGEPSLRPAPGAGPVAASAPGTDSVSLSGGTRMLPDAMLKGPPIDMSTVEKLGAEIAQGRYPVDPERIAAAICRECFDFSV